jgi:cell division protein ZapA
MPNVDVEIAGRKYRMACEEGQEEHLFSLAARFNKSVDDIKGSVGEVGDARLTVMAGIAVLDELVAAEQTIARLQQDVVDLTRAGEELSTESEELERRLARQLTDVDETGSPGN